MLHKFHYSSNHRREIPIVIHRPIRCSTRDLYLAVSNFFLRRRNRNPDGKKENEPKPSHFKRSRRVDDSHEVSCSCTVTVPCSFWLDQLAGPSSISTLPGSTMRVDNHGRSPESHCWPGLSDSVEQTMAAKEICVCQCKCSVSIACN